MVDYTLDELQEMLEPEKFLRINRSYLVSIESITKIDDYFGQRLILQLQPLASEEVVVSREKVTPFKIWMGK